MGQLIPPPVDLAAIGPHILLFLFAMALLLLSAFKVRPLIIGYLALLGVVLTMLACMLSWGNNYFAFAKMIRLDDFGLFFSMIFLLATGLTILSSMGYLPKLKVSVSEHEGEYYGLLLFACVGMMFMAAGTNMITIFIGLETMSISSYMLAGFIKSDRRSNEAALKYFLLGAFSTGFLLYGMALLYGATGTLDLKDIADFIAKSQLLSHPMLLGAIGLLIVGLGFKIASVPFHMWTPDVYEGAPTPITAFMAVGVKAASFAAFLRIFGYALPAVKPHWQEVIWILAVLTMTLGNVVAIVQDNIKRMLAYSSIAHAGYILVALVAITGKPGDLASSSILFYLLAYTLMNIGAFCVVILYGRKAEDNLNIPSYAGMGYQFPLLGASMALFMFSMAGIPPTAGFVAKFYVFSAAIKEGFIWLAIIGVLNSVVSVYYYLRVTVMIYMKPREQDAPQSLFFNPAVSLATVLTAAGVLLLGILPGPFITIAKQSVMHIFN
jgi:NADH-quinone oxidoreductase subunit N